jgi:hypothetical protein
MLPRPRRALSVILQVAFGRCWAYASAYRSSRGAMQRHGRAPAPSKSSGVDTRAGAPASCPDGTREATPLMPEGANRPLAGITVLDFGQVYQGPYATLLMAKAGADVIKIEPPQGEPLRRRAPPGKSTTFPTYKPGFGSWRGAVRKGPPFSSAPIPRSPKLRCSHRQAPCDDQSARSNHRSSLGRLKAGSHRTHCWRKEDSNRWSHLSDSTTAAPARCRQPPASEWN